MSLPIKNGSVRASRCSNTPPTNCAPCTTKVATCVRTSPSRSVGATPCGRPYLPPAPPAPAAPRPAAPVVDTAGTERLIDGFIKGMETGDPSAWDLAVAEHPKARIDLEALSLLAVHHLFAINDRNRTRNVRIDALEARLATVEARPQLEHRGSWSGLTTYPANSLVTSAGALWLATAAPPLGERPGNGKTSWRLIVKSGDAR